MLSSASLGKLLCWPLRTQKVRPVTRAQLEKPSFSLGPEKVRPMTETCSRDCAAACHTAVLWIMLAGSGKVKGTELLPAQFSLIFYSWFGVDRPKSASRI